MIFFKKHSLQTQFSEVIQYFSHIFSKLCTKFLIIQSKMTYSHISGHLHATKILPFHYSEDTLHEQLGIKLFWCYFCFGRLSFFSFMCLKFRLDSRIFFGECPSFLWFLGCLLVLDFRDFLLRVNLFKAMLEPGSRR